MFRPSDEHPLPWRHVHVVVAGRAVGSNFSIVAANGIEVARITERPTAEFICLMANSATSLVGEYDSAMAGRRA